MNTTLRHLNSLLSALQQNDNEDSHQANDAHSKADNNSTRDDDEMSRLRAEVAALKDSVSELDATKTELEGIRTRRDELERDNERLKREAAANAASSDQRRLRDDKFWQDTGLKMLRDPDAVITMILNKEIDIHRDVNRKGEGILQLAARIGAYDVVQLLLNLGAGADSEEVDAAFEGAYKNNQYHVVQLLEFSKLKGGDSDEIKETAQNIGRQNGVIDNLMKQLSKLDDDSKQIFQDVLQAMMENHIESKQSFSDDLLNLCLRFEREKGTGNILDTKLWKCISKTCSQIIESGSKLDWFWLKNVMLPSTIWFKDINAKSNKKPAYLYYELLKLVDGQAKAGLDTLDKNLQDLAAKDKDAWKLLIDWDIPDEYDVVRQDAVPNAITPKYTQQRLSTASSSTFNAHSFYDHQEYLSQLVLLAQMVDDEFQKSVQRVFNVDKKTMMANLNVSNDDDEKEKKQAGDGLVRYSRGPVKLIERARAKAQTDYADHPYPASACVLDLNRCSLIFNDIATMLKAIELFVNKVKYYQSGSIIAVVRDKNGFKAYEEKTQYADIKLNVLIKGKTNCIIGEVQFLLNTMKKFKEKAHNLYAIQRQQEYFDDSVTQILPILLHDDIQAGIAANLDDVKTMSRLMVLHNKTEDEIMAIDKIMDNVCQLGNEKMLRFLASTISPDLFVERLFNDQSIFSIFLVNNYSCAQIVLSLDAVRRKFQSDEGQNKTSLMGILFACCSLTLIDYTLRALDISDQEILAYMQKHADLLDDVLTENKNPGVVQRLLSLVSDPETRLVQSVDAVLTKDRTELGSLQTMASNVGSDILIERVFVAENRAGRNILEQCIYRPDKKEMLKYLLSFTEIRERCQRDRQILFRVVGWLLYPLRLKGDVTMQRTEVAEYVLETLQLDEAKLKDLQSYEYPKPADWEEEEEDEDMIYLAIGKKAKYWEPEWRIDGKQIEEFLSRIKR